MPLSCALQHFFTNLQCTIFGQKDAFLGKQWDTSNVSDYQHK